MFRKQLHVATIQKQTGYSQLIEALNTNQLKVDYFSQHWACPVDTCNGGNLDLEQYKLNLLKPCDADAVQNSSFWDNIHGVVNLNFQAFGKATEFLPIDHKSSQQKSYPGLGYSQKFTNVILCSHH